MVRCRNVSVTLNVFENEHQKMYLEIANQHLLHHAILAYRTVRKVRSRKVKGFLYPFPNLCRSAMPPQRDRRQTYRIAIRNDGRCSQCAEEPIRKCLMRLQELRPLVDFVVALPLPTLVTNLRPLAEHVV